MKVVLEASARRRPGFDRGIGRYVSAVRRANDVLGNEVEELVCTSTDGRLSEFTSLARRMHAMRAMDFELFHAPTAYYTTIERRGRPSVVSILDVIPLDLAAHRQTGLKARLFHRLASRADVILTLSEHAAGRIEQLLRVDRERIVVAPLPPGPDFVPSGSSVAQIPRPYVAMMVDMRTSDPRKRANWLPVLAAHLQAHGISIALVGGGTKSAAMPGVWAFGRVDDQHWASILRGADAFVYTSAYEGQGLPPLEAIACGTPVVAMSNTSIPEVVGSAGVLIEDGHGDASAAALASAAVDFVGDSELQLRTALECEAQTARFTFERFVQGIASAYAMAVEARR